MSGYVVVSYSFYDSKKTNNRKRNEEKTVGNKRQNSELAYSAKMRDVEQLN